MDMDRYIGRLLDNRYEILEVLGTGGMAVVYKAKCHRLNRFVAIKILKDENLQDADFRRRFRAEGQAVAMLSHPNIVSVYDVSTSGDEDYIVMELVDGITLKQYMEKKGVLNWKETLHFAMQIAKALEHAHSRGIVHRDIKPHNVMVLKNGSVRVTDFGIARDMSKSATLTKEALGSVHYISPEQARGGLVDNRSDLYSLGIVMYEMITGRPPFDGESPVSVAIQHIAGGATKPSVLNPNMPAGLEQIIVRAMAHDLKDRYDSATQMLADMDALRQEPTMVFAEKIAAKPKPKQTPVKPETPAEKIEVPAKPEKKIEVPKKSKKERTYEDIALSRGRIATAAIISCSIAAMVAIIIFLVLLANGGLFQEPEQTIRVPDLVGMHYERLPNYDGIHVIAQGEPVYSDQYAAGVIMQQLPLAHTEVEVGRTVFVTISAGPKPEDVKIRDLVGVSQMEAESYLANLDMNLQVEIQQDYHDNIPEDFVIRCNLPEGAVLHRGQKIVLTISLGREPQLQEMPNLLRGGGLQKEDAEQQLNIRGFKNVEWIQVDSELPKGTVLSQSVPAREVIDITTHIVIEYSSGNSPDNPPATIQYVFELPVRDEAYLLSILSGGEFLVIDYTIEPGVSTYVMELSGKGTAYFDLYVDGVFYQTVTVDFGIDE